MSTSSLYRTAAAAAVALGSLPLLGAAASAQTTCYPPTPGCVPSISLSDTTVTRNQTVGATVAGFRAGSSGIITIASVEQQIGSFTMPAGGGSTTTSVTIPGGISLGAHTVFARGVGLDGQPASASQAVTVVAGGGGGGGGTGTTVSGGGSTLARTGAALGIATVVGVGLVLGGMAMKRSGRRRPTSAG